MVNTNPCGLKNFRLLWFIGRSSFSIFEMTTFILSVKFTYYQRLRCWRTYWYTRTIFKFTEICEWFIWMHRASCIWNALYKIEKEFVIQMIGSSTISFIHFYLYFKLLKMNMRICDNIEFPTYLRIINVETTYEN